MKTVTSTLAAVVLALVSTVVAAAPAAVEPFRPSTWADLQAASRTGASPPTLVFFTATWCAVCPQHLQQLAADRARRAAGVALVVVVTDVPPGDDDARLLATPHYRAADRLLAFDAPAAALRATVDPGWRGVVPAVAWLPSRGAPAFVQGMPPDATRAGWFRATGAPVR